MNHLKKYIIFVKDCQGVVVGYVKIRPKVRMMMMMTWRILVRSHSSSHLTRLLSRTMSHIYFTAVCPPYYH